MRRFSQLAATAFAVAALVVSAAAPANADTIAFAGSSSGCFNCASGGSTTASIGGLTFDAATFAGVTADASGSALIDLGTMALDWSSYNYSKNHTTFLLNVTFTDPANLAGSYGAQIEGSVNLLGNGSVNVQLDKSFQTYTFANTAGHGSFDFGIFDPSLHFKPGESLTLWGVVQGLQYTATPSTGGTGGDSGGPNEDPLQPGGETGGAANNPDTPVPEPMMLLLMGGGVAVALRRRATRQA